MHWTDRLHRVYIASTLQPRPPAGPGAWPSRRPSALHCTPSFDPGRPAHKTDERGAWFLDEPWTDAFFEAPLMTRLIHYGLPQDKYEPNLTLLLIHGKGRHKREGIRGEDRVLPRISYLCTLKAFSIFFSLIDLYLRKSACKRRRGTAGDITPRTSGPGPGATEPDGAPGFSFAAGCG